MRQILQNLGTGETQLADVPSPQAGPGRVLIRTGHSLISAGTERMLLEFGKANLLDKARSQPEKVRQVLDKIRTDGLSATLSTVRNKLDQPIPLGYSNAGVVLALGEGVTSIDVGDRVASNGPHAEIVCVPENLCARVPDGVSDEAAAFTVVGAIALQGIRLAGPTLGESFAVVGLGLVGLMTVQLLRGSGCRVLGIDTDPARIKLARTLGAEVVDISDGGDPVAHAMSFSGGRGVDGVLFTASTKSSEPMHQAAEMCRKRGRIVLVGVAGLELRRSDFYEKELTFQVSCSYGPGRYDPLYEESGHDYPFGFVRWTERRNFEAVLDMLASGRLEIESLVSHRFPVARALDAYGLLGSGEPSLGIVLDYTSVDEPSNEAVLERTVRIGDRGDAARPPAGRGAVGFVGSGNYATAVLIPAFKSAGAELVSVASRGGASAVHAAKKFGFDDATTDTSSLINDGRVDTLVVATRHDSHAALVCEALEAGKHVFVEKPLAITREELDEIESVYRGLESRPLLMVGFNRRFAPHIRKIAGVLTKLPGPRSFIMTVNAGAIPPEHWTQDPKVGGGRIVGEGCHFVDLLRFLAAARISSVHASGLGGAGGARNTRDSASLTLGFEDGSIGTIHYLANGSRSFPKERLEVFCGGAVLVLDNFRRLTGYGCPGFRSMNLRRQDKGQRDCAAAFVESVRAGGPAPIGFDELMEVSRVTIDLADRLRGEAEEQ